ncbi:MAG: GNAT family N-acetyltransferase [Candidatus Sumerlaeia bacterium]|nr:GNAT family N-acetyltransferase [Candidatus Sumerlaeia bacterium]
MSLEITPVAPGDEADLCRLVRELAEYEKLLDQCAATPETLRAALFGEPRQCEAVLARLDGAVVGMAIFFPLYSTFLAAPGIHLHDLYVTPSARRNGVGTALLAWLAAECGRRGAKRLEWIVLHWNELALSRYRALGAEVADEWRLMRLEGDGLAALARRADS